jgi:hypothetical protein
MKDKYFLDYVSPTKKPLRSARELAEEFGVSIFKLATLIKTRNGPAPKIKHRQGAIVKNTWYDPKEIRTWWKTLDL